MPPDTTDLSLLAASAGSVAYAVAQSLAGVRRPHAVLCRDEQQADRLEAELRFFAGDRHEVLHLPSTEVLPYESFSPHQEILSDRLGALHHLSSMRDGVLVTTADALIQRLPPPAWLQGRTFHLRRGDTLNREAFRSRLVAAGYQSVSEVQMQGEFAVRGSLLDLFPMGSDVPFRIDLFDDAIDSIRPFEPETQRSLAPVDAVRLMPAREFPTDPPAIEAFRRRYRAQIPGDPSRSRIYTGVSSGLLPGGIESWLPLFFDETAALTDYLPDDTRIIEVGELEPALAADWQQVCERHDRHAGDLERPILPPDVLFHTPSRVLEQLAGRERHPLPEAADPLRPDDRPVRDLLDGAGVRVLFVAESPGRREALQAWLRPQGRTAARVEDWRTFADAGPRVGITLGPLQTRVRLRDGTILVPESEVFGLTAPTRRRRTARVRDPATLLRDLTDLAEGAPVVHVQHGVGRYRGLKTMDSGGIRAEYLVLEYAGSDTLYVPVASLDSVHRYVGGEQVPLHALGADRWRKAQDRARRRAHDVAAELLDIQARRAARPGRAMAAQAEDRARFCAGFPFTPTPDQQQAIDQVMADLAVPKPMDRVVCGDVGFGKTEVALRASFTALQAGRQVCVLVPTTLLAQQHHKNFSDRFADWPFRVGALSRLRGRAGQAEELGRLADGTTDVIIGTHRLLQPDVAFRDLGLVIIDEEHRFGVRHKEAMKGLRAEVDVLTLTATPIPRTLNLALAGLRDLSIIATAPEGRLPIRTVVAEYNRGLVHEACLRELRRGGQVYVLHNEVRDIEQSAAALRELLPEARVRVAHGQMRERELEQVMLDFYHRRFDILVCTTIIESGIDVPSANTLVVDRADTFGLAQLHQLRGRVGRSHHRAYAYLLVPSLRALKPDAQRRLEAIEAMGELGSGFQLATHDLEIRGAGELLGARQSGQIDEVGFTLYSELLEQAVREHRDQPAPLRAPCEVDLGVTTLLPEDYIPDVHARLVLYKRLAATEAAALHELRAEMVDRFGSLPDPAERLFDAAGLARAARPLGVTRVRLEDGIAWLSFAPQTPVSTTRLLAWIQSDIRTRRLTRDQKLRIELEGEAIDAQVDALATVLATLATLR